MAGVRALEVERWDEALEALQGAVAVDPADHLALAYCGLALLRVGRVGEAREVVDRAVSLAPGSFVCAMRRGEILARLGYYDTASNELRRALTLRAPDERSYHALLELLEYCKQKSKGLYYRRLAPPSSFSLRNIFRRSSPVTP